MFDFLNYDLQVAGYSASARGVAFTLYGKSHALLPAGRDVKRYCFVFSLSAFAVAIAAGLLYDFPLSFALRADAYSFLRAEESLNDLTYRSGSMAGGTSGESCAVLCAGAVAMLTSHVGGNSEGLVNPRRDFRKRKFDRDTEVGTSALGAL